MKEMITFIVDRDYKGRVYEIQSQHFSNMLVRDRSEFNNIYRHILPKDFGMKANFRSNNKKYDVDLQGNRMILVDELDENEKRKLNLNGIEFAFIPTPEEMEKFNRKDYQLAYLHYHNCLIPKSKIYPVSLNEGEKSLIIKDIVENFSGKIVIKEPTECEGNGNTFLDLREISKVELKNIINEKIINNSNTPEEKTFIVQEQAHEEKEDKNVKIKGYATYRSIISYVPDEKLLMLGTVSKNITKNGSVDSHQSDETKLYFGNSDTNSRLYKSYKQNKYGTKNHIPEVQDNMKRTAEAGYELYQDINSLSHEEFLIELSKKGSEIIYKNCIVRAAQKEKNRKLNNEELLYALREGDFNRVKIAIDIEANANAVYYVNRTPLHLAAEGGHAEIVELLLEKGANANAVDCVKRTPLHLAAEGGHAEIVKLLLKKGANANAVDCVKRTPLHLAAKGGHAEIVELLLKKGANANAVDYVNRTPLDLARENGHQEIITLLEEAQKSSRPPRSNYDETVVVSASASQQR